jgi:acyl-CoA synthetase (AMP-forming)/AMP-acid ligase II/thioesterase domain-containing protein/acyl carrier protein
MFLLNMASNVGGIATLREGCDFHTLFDLLAHHADRFPQRLALSGVDGVALDYARLLAKIQQMGHDLRRQGIERSDRVALVLPNGADLAVSFLGVATWSVAAPLNPSLSSYEFESYFEILRIKALAVPQGHSPEARQAAAKLGIPVIEIALTLGSEAGCRPGSNRNGSIPMSLDRPASEDTALVLCTSGTTSKPKCVPFTHGNIAAITSNICRAHSISDADRSLNVLPLFHLHGLLGGMLAPLWVGGTVVCTPGIDVSLFFDWLRRYAPTYVTAVPAMYQAILKYIELEPSAAAGRGLRFLRSASSPLPPTVMEHLEKAFGVPVIEIYGLTETGPLTSNRLPPGQRKLGSAGVPAGPELAIVDHEGHRLPPGGVGEVVVRGPNVMRGYDQDEAANKSAFRDGWFCTGDQGYLDEDGYLFLTGRLKEMINRAGEKVAPREVEDVLLTHPAVGQAAVFGVPHEILGEMVGAVVVLHHGQAASEQDLRKFVAKRLVEYKVPARILTVAQLPLSATGKVQRTNLARQLGLEALAAGPFGPEANGTAPTTEGRLAKIWMKLFGVQRVTPQDNFFALGGDSLSAAALLLDIERSFGTRLLAETLYYCQTIADLARQIDMQLATSKTRHATLVPVNAGQGGPALFFIPPPGHPFSFRDLSRYLDSWLPTFVFETPPGTLFTAGQEELQQEAARYVEAMVATQPEGPYCLAGYSKSAVLVFEMAQQLYKLGKQVAFLGLLDARCPGYSKGPARHQRVRRVIERLGQVFLPPQFLTAASQAAPTKLRYTFRDLVKAVRNNAASMVQESLDSLGNGSRPAIYRATGYPGTITVYRAQIQHFVHYAQRTLGWDAVCKEGVQVHDIPGHHDSICLLPNVRILAKFMNHDLARALGHPS